MNRRLDALLVKNHPLLFADRTAPMTQTCMCWGFECGNGWYGIIKRAADKLEPLIAKFIADHPEIKEQGWYPRASQVKEKYGTLRFYMFSENDEMFKIVQQAERESAKTCETCSRPGHLYGPGWYMTRCARCARKLRKQGRTMERVK